MKNKPKSIVRVLMLMIILAVIVLTPASQPVSAGGGYPLTTVRVLAYIDGLSQFVIQGDSAHWYHLHFAAPGRHMLLNKATHINKQVWYPIWPDIPDAENRDCYCDSSSYSAIPALAPIDQNVTLNVLYGRYEVRIVQQPSAANDYTLIVEFDDDPPGGADWYKIEVTYQTLP